ncbi:MAG TPA: hypothetical protein VFD82_02840 [Planctomycetota bacterium]|nr:hypothetical protein [Planctomycetota bacterium]
MQQSALLLPWLLVASLAAQGLPWDVPHRGAHVYERTTDEFEVSPPPSRLRPQWVIEREPAEPHEWRYFTCPRDGVPQGFEQPAFADANWQLGCGEFGNDAGKDKNQRTLWRSDDLCLRTRLDLGAKKPRALWFAIDHDDGIRIWLNGALVVADDGYGRNRHYAVMGSQLDAWRNGMNTLAVRCSQIRGPQYLDLAVAMFDTLPAGIRTADDLVQQLREEQENANKARRELFGAYRAPPLLLQGDLDGLGQRVRIAPADLRDLGWWMAMDLSYPALGGLIQADAGRLLRLGDLLVKGRASAIEPDGWQTLELTVANTVEPAQREDTKRHVDRFVRPHVWYGFDGKLKVQRRLSIKNGKTRVEEFKTDLRGRIVRGKDWKETVAQLVQRETWRYARSHDNQDIAFREMVANSLQRGEARLRKQLSNLGDDLLKREKEDGDRSYHSGRLALGLLALIKGSTSKDDDVVQKGLEELRQRTLIDSYSLGNALMCFEALYAPANEIGNLTAGAIDRPRRREPNAADKALMQKWTERLLTNADTRVDPQSVLRFHYIGGADFDNSTNQYGVLGLYSAHLCGIDVGPTVWEAAANHLLASQGSQGGKLELNLVDYRTHAQRRVDPEASLATRKSVALNAANGWTYKEPKDDGEQAPVWGSMTCAGITGLAICQAALQDYPLVKRHKLTADMVRARNDGFAWLARFMTQRCHPGAIERQHRFFYYYLYSLERAALLSGVALIQDRDWYFEGAMVLVLAQLADGSWPAELQVDNDNDEIARNAMAILFLKQSTLPVLTGK